MEDKAIKNAVRNLAELYGVEKQPAEAHTVFLNRVILRLAEEITRYQNLNSELYRRINEAVEQSPQYQQLVSECQRLELTSSMWRESCEKAEKELKELQAQEATAAAAITQEPEQTPQNDTQKEPVKVPELKRPDKGRPRRIKDEATIQEILELRRQGYSFMTISEQYGTSDETISRICRKYGVKKETVQ